MEKRFALVDGQSLLVQVERPASAHALALVVDAVGAGDEADRLVAGFHAQGVATARVALPVGLGRHGATERWITGLSDWARVEEADGLPICFAGVGAASSHVLRAAALARPIAGVVA